MAGLFLKLFNMNKFEHRAVNITLSDSSALAIEDIKIPDGKIIAIGAVVVGNTDNEIINLCVKQNGNEVLSPSDYRFSEPKAGGNFVQSLRPVDIDGGRLLSVELQAFANSRSNEVKAQVLFVVLKPESASCS
nr:hypothetical protein [Flavobacterium suncheonense]